MAYFGKTKLRIAMVALVVAASAGTTASAFGVGNPIPPNLTFPQEGAFENRSANCFLFACKAKAQITKDTAKPKNGE